MSEQIPHDVLERLVTDHVLGRIADAEEVAAVTAHLAVCATCPGLAAEIDATAAALRRLVDPEDDADLPAPPPPRSLDARIETLLAAGDPVVAPVVAPVDVPVDAPVDALPTAGRERGRGRRLALLAAAASIGMAIGAGATTLLDRPDPAPVAVPGPVVLPVADLGSAAGVRASAGVVDHTWGIEIKLNAAGLAARASYDVVVIGDDGRQYPAGAFIGVEGRPVVCNMNTDLLLARAASFAVLDDRGTPLIWGDLPEPQA